jgi:hypothetical protein
MNKTPYIKDTVDITVNEIPFSFKVVIERSDEDRLWVAQCLELDLVATAQTLEATRQDMLDIITTQVRYALENDNMEYLFHSAPQAVWDKYFGKNNNSLSVVEKSTIISLLGLSADQFKGHGWDELKMTLPNTEGHRDLVAKMRLRIGEGVTQYFPEGEIVVPVAKLMLYMLMRLEDAGWRI